MKSNLLRAFRPMLAAACIAVASGCALLMPSAAPVVTDAEVSAPPFAVAWTARDSVVLVDVDGSERALEPFTRLEAEGLAGGRVQVRCDVCGGEISGSVKADDLIAEALYPQPASYGSLSQFALSVRQAAERRDLDALRSVMVPEFTYSFVGPHTRDAALEVWRSEDFAALAEVPSLLDQGLGTTEGRIWSAPDAYRTDLSFRGSRVGFRRNEVGRWEWLYLIRGIAP